MSQKRPREETAEDAERDRNNRPQPPPPRDWRDAYLHDGRPDRSRRGSGELQPRGGRGHHDLKRNTASFDRSSSYPRKPYEPAKDRDQQPQPPQRPRENNGRTPSTSSGFGQFDKRPPSSPRHHSSKGFSRPEDVSLPYGNDEKEDGEISTPPPPRPDSSLSRQPSVPRSTSHPPVPPTEPPPPAPEPQPEIELSLPTSPPPIEQMIAERRAKRLAILAKYQDQNIPSSQSATASPAPGPVTENKEEPATKVKHDGESNGRMATPAAGSDGQATPIRRSATPSSFSLTKDNKESNVGAGGSIDLSKPTADQAEREQVSAADYDPSLDRRQEEERRAIRNAIADGIGEIPVDKKQDVMDVDEEEVEEGEEVDLDDMFAVGAKVKKVKKNKSRTSAPKALAVTTADTAADPEGYYQIILGEALDGGRYQVFSSLGKGMFSAVVRARVIEDGREVAIKIIRAQETMYKAGLKEVQILNKLAQADPDDKKHLIRLERTFEHRGHLCLVFESLSMNLREVIKRFGKDVGLNIRAVRAYAYQLFLALSLLRKCNVMHADIKPDNILVNEQKTVLKVCDLGSASDIAENDIAPYLVSRFYRAPEIILGLPYDASLDVWSIGCTLYELYTGKILFPGRSNNQMLLYMMELKGRFNSKMIKKAKFGDVHFDDSGGFISVEQDKITGKDTTRKVFISKPSRDLRARLVPSSSASAKMKDDELKLILSFVDLLEKCLSLDPSRRITPKEALMHPFVRG